MVFGDAKRPLPYDCDHLSKQPERLNLVVKYCFIWGVGIGVLASAVYGIFNVHILQLFTDQQDVIDTAMVYFAWTIAGPTVSSFSYIWDGIFIGATATAPMRNSMIIATGVVFLPAYGIGVYYLGNHALWLAMTLFMVARGATLGYFAPTYILKSNTA